MEIQNPCAIGRELLILKDGKIENKKQETCFFQSEIPLIKNYINILSKVLGKNYGDKKITDHSVDLIIQMLEDCFVKLTSQEDIRETKKILSEIFGVNISDSILDPKKINILVSQNLGKLAKIIDYFSKMKKSLRIPNNGMKNYNSWLTIGIIESILKQLEFNSQSKNINYFYSGFNTYDDFEYALMPNDPMPEKTNNLKFNYIISRIKKYKNLSIHYIINTCCRFSTGRHFVSMVIQSEESKKYPGKIDVYISYFDSQRIQGPYKNNEEPPDSNIIQRMIEGNPYYKNKYKNYKSKFYDWYEYIENNFNNDKEIIFNTPSQPFYNLEKYQQNNFACGIYSMYFGYIYYIIQTPFKSSIDLYKYTSPFIKNENEDTDNRMAEFLKAFTI